MVRLSDVEKQQLEAYRDSEYGEDKPLGAVISALLRDEQVAEQKEILITGVGRADQYPDSDNSSRARIIARPIGEDGKKLRGYTADIVILLTEIPSDVRGEVINPMRAEVIELY